jgi:EF hand
MVSSKPKEEQIMKARSVQMLSLLAGTVFGMSAASASTAGHPESSKASASLQQEFKTFDMDGDGYLSLEEVQASTETAFKAADLDGDRRLSLAEYAKYMKTGAGKKGTTEKPAERASAQPTPKPAPE